jgi:hypothetical protein
VNKLAHDSLKSNHHLTLSLVKLYKKARKTGVYNSSLTHWLKATREWDDKKVEKINKLLNFINEINNSDKIDKQRIAKFYRKLTRSLIGFKKAKGEHWITLPTLTQNPEPEADRRHILLDEEGNILGGDLPRWAQGKNIRNWWKEKTTNEDKKENLKDTEKESIKNEVIDNLKRLQNLGNDLQDVIKKLHKTTITDEDILKYPRFSPIAAYPQEIIIERVATILVEGQTKYLNRNIKFKGFLYGFYKNHAGETKVIVRDYDKGNIIVPFEDIVKVQDYKDIDPKIAWKMEEIAELFKKVRKQDVNIADLISKYKEHKQEYGESEANNWVKRTVEAVKEEIEEAKAKKKEKIQQKVKDIRFKIKEMLKDYGVEDVEFNKETQKLSDKEKIGEIIVEAYKIMGKILPRKTLSNTKVKLKVGKFEHVKSKKVLAYYMSNEKTIYISDKKGFEPFFHEYGHAIDHMLIGSHEDTASENGILRPLIEQIKQINSFKQFITRSTVIKDFGYWVRPTEIFARWFAYYIAWKCKKTSITLPTELDYDKFLKQYEQYTDEEMEQTSKTFEQILKTNGFDKSLFILTRTLLKGLRQQYSEGR